MPKFMKDRAIELLDGGIEAYLLALYGMSLPSMHDRRKQETKYAPIIGLFGASVELIAKACMVQAKGTASMYKNGNIDSGVYRFGTEILDELKTSFRNAETHYDFIWQSHEKPQDLINEFINHFDKFKMLQGLRENGLHAGVGCSRDVTTAIANDIFDFITVLCKCRRFKAYIKNIPAPEATVRDTIKICLSILMPCLIY